MCWQIETNVAGVMGNCAVNLLQLLPFLMLLLDRCTFLSSSALVLRELKSLQNADINISPFCVCQVWGSGLWCRFRALCLRRSEES